MFGHRVDANILLYIILLIDMIEYGRLCVDVLRLETRGDLTWNGFRRPRLSWIEHFQRLKEAHALGVPAPNVKTCVDRDGKT